MRRLTPAAPVLCLVLLAGCSQNPRHQLTVASSSVASALFAIQDSEEVLYRSGQITGAQHVAFNTELVKALVLGRDFNAAILAWRPGQPLPAQLAGLRESLLRLSSDLLMGVDPAARTQIQATIATTYDAVLMVLLATQGGAS